MKNYCACCGKVSNTSTDTCSAICASILATRRAEGHRFRTPELRPIVVTSEPKRGPAVVFVKMPPRVTTAQLEAAERTMRKPWWRRFLDWMVEPIDIRGIE